MMTRTEQQIFIKIANELEKQNLMLDTLTGEIERLTAEVTRLKGDDYSLESITRAIQNQRR